ncbi:hypothetical protein R3P38DRAFT_2780612 [Favolaschia claudopus]|uniref:Uncharacterized protein n=1 Tax=Favolaschia claudopus TaxID=2862362 RepID=A0AAW0B919_9AGAR
MSFLDIRAAVIFAHTCQLMRVNVQDAVRVRVLALTIPFFHGDLDKVRRFFGVMRLTNSVVNGSIPTLVMDWSVPTDGLRGLMISNLNVVAPLGAHKFVCDYLTAILRDATRRDGNPSEEYGAVASKFTVLTLLRKTTQHLSITVTESRTTSAMPVILAAGCTSQHNVLTATRLICPNIDMTSRSEALFAWPFASTGVALARWSKPLVPPPLHGIVRVEHSNSGWTTACGYGCPSRKRQIRGFKAIGEFAWGGIRGEFDTPGGREWTTNVARDVEFRWRTALVILCAEPTLDGMKDSSNRTGNICPFATRSLVVFDESPGHKHKRTVRGTETPARRVLDDSNVGVGRRSLTRSNDHQFCGHIHRIRTRSHPRSKLKSRRRVLLVDGLQLALCGDRDRHVGVCKATEFWCGAWACKGHVNRLRGVERVIVLLILRTWTETGGYEPGCRALFGNSNHSASINCGGVKLSSLSRFVTLKQGV